MSAINYVLSHSDNLPIGTESWALRHWKATLNPQSTGERAIWSFVQAIAYMIDAQAKYETTPADDYILRPHFRALISAARAYLNFDVGRFDCGTLDALILHLAEMGGLSESDL